MALEFGNVGNMSSKVILGARKGGPDGRRHRRLGVFHGIRGNQGKCPLWFAEEGKKNRRIGVRPTVRRITSQSLVADRSGVADVMESQAMQTDLILSGHQAEKSARVNSRWAFRIIGTMVIVLLAGSSAFGQFLIQPVRLQVPVQPGKRFQTEIKLENLSRLATETVGLRIVDITQDVNGLWDDIERDEPGIDRSTLRSCADWLRLEQDSAEVSPGGVFPLKVLIEVPPGMRGYYFAAIMARSAPRVQEVEGQVATTILEYLVPVILEAQGRIMRHEVELTGVGLEFQQQTPTKAAATMVTLDVENGGGTFSRLQGLTRIWAQSNGHWRKITEAQFLDLGIIPGAKLHLKQDVGRPLGSGKYKVEGYLYVDGRRSGQVQKEFEFAGDPRVAITRNSSDALDLESKDLLLETNPGSVRVGQLPVIDASDEAVTVTATVSLPEHMQGAVGAGGVAGESFGCSDWVTVEPQQFSLVGHGTQNLRVVAKMPNPPATVLANYYAIIKLTATYADGKPGGVTMARLCVRNRMVKPTPQIGNLVWTVAQSSPSRYLALARFINNGDLHVLPKCRAALINPLDGSVWTRLVLTSEGPESQGMLLPMDTRNFSGVLDVSNVAVGLYRLIALLEYPGGSAMKSIAIEVVDGPTGKVANVLPGDRVAEPVNVKF